MATIEDVSRVLHQVEKSARTQVLRIVLHPEDFRTVASSAAFSSAPYGPSQVAARGTLWGIDVHVDPRNEKGIAYVVTKDDARQRGTPYPLEIPYEAPRRTAWARVLEDNDDLGVDTKGERQDDGSHP